MKLFPLKLSPPDGPAVRQPELPVGVSRPGLITAAAVSLVLLVLLQVFARDVLFWWQRGLWALAVAAPIPFRLRLRQSLSVWLARACFLLYPPAAFLLLETLNQNEPLHNISPLRLVLNLAFYYLVASLFYLLFRRTKTAAGAVLIFFWGLGLANSYVMRFRGRAIFPADFLSLGTAANVAANYNYRPSDIQITATLTAALLLSLLTLLPRQEERARLRLRSALPTAAAWLVFLAVFFPSPFLERAGVAADMLSTNSNGFVLNFSLYLRLSFVSRPEGYSVQAVSNLAQQVDGTPPGADVTTPTNLIVIMNESYADLSVLGDLETNTDYFPFLHSLTENTVKGLAYASVFGGNTANSEYEFLTGNTTAYHPPGTIAYQLYVKEGEHSLVEQLNGLGYRSLALHPFYSSGWNRVQVYEHLGFSQSLFFEDFQDLQWIRAFVSDWSDYDNLIRLCREKEAGEKLFLFNVTMQNHGAYNQEWINLPREVWLTGELEGKYPMVDQFLSLMYQSDRALEHLIQSFSQVDEPTMILMFGDHQPQVESAFYQELLGKDPNAATAQRKQAVPFLIWANYDIPEQDGVVLSPNYLSSLLMETANLPTTGYQQFLSRLRQSVPVVNAMGYATADGLWTDRESALPQPIRSALQEYQILQYNNTFAPRSERLESFFSLGESP